MARTLGSIPIRIQALHTVLAAARRRIRMETAGGRLRGRTLLLARGVWIALAAITFALYIAAVWQRILKLNTSCPIGRITQYHGPAVCPPSHAGQLPLAVQRAIADAHVSAAFVGGYALGLNVLFAAGFAVVAILIFWRRSHDLLAIFVSLALLLFGVGSFENGLIASGLPSVSSGWWLVAALVSFLGEMTFGIFIAIFPNGHVVPRWTRVALLALVLWWLPNIFFPNSPFDFDTWPAVLFFAGWAFLFVMMGSAQIYRYQHVSTPIQRQQTKWVVFGFVGAGIGYFGGRLIGFFLSPALTTPTAVLADLAGGTLIYVGLLMIPLTIGIAMLRYHLFDIDVIIRRTLIYSAVTGTLAAVYTISSIVLQAGFEAITRQASAPAVILSTLAIAALFQPVRSRVQTAVDQRFYRRKFDAARAVAAFGTHLRSDVDLAQLTRDLLVLVDETMQPGHVSLWLVQAAHETEHDVGYVSDGAETVIAPTFKQPPLPGLFAAPDNSRI